MLLKDLICEQGNFLFRWRSYLPLGLVPLLVIAVSEPAAFEHWFSRQAEFGWELANLGVALSGLLLRAVTVGFAPAGTSGRNTERQVAESLNTEGLYSVTRNPLYLGNFLVVLGIVLAIKVWWLVLIIVTAFALYYERIICAEEAFLESKFDVNYRTWAARTPVFFPDLRLWRRAEASFSIRTVLRREFHGLYLIVVAFTLIEFGHDLVEGATLTGWIDKGAAWIVFFWCGTLIYLALMILKKQTRILDVAGR